MKIAFFGTPDIAVPVLQSLIDSDHEVVCVITQPDKPVGRKQTLTPPPVKELAEKNGIRIFQPENCRHLVFIKEYKQIEVDLNVVIAYGQIIPDEVIYHPFHDSINIHASLLPKYRGASPINHAIMNGDTETGITYQFIKKELDAGDIIHREKITIDDNDTSVTLYEKLKKLAADTVVNVATRISKGSFTREPQNEEEVSYVGMIKKEDGAIDFNAPSETIRNKVRGLLPWPVAFCTFNGKKMKIFSCSFLSSDSTSEPGTIIGTIKNKGFIVKTGDDSLLVTDIQLEGKKRMSASDFIVGHQDIVGKKLI